MADGRHSAELDLERDQRLMIQEKPFSYQPELQETQSAANSYIMSMVAVLVGMPLPIINLLATLGFAIGQRRNTYFVRWHATQALLSQFSLLIMNSVGFYWTLSIMFSSREVSNLYIAYMITIALYNLTEFVATIYTAIQVGKGRHITWFFFGDLTENLVHER